MVYCMLFIFFKCVLCSFSFLIGFNAYLLQIQIYLVADLITFYITLYRDLSNYFLVFWPVPMAVQSKACTVYSH